MQHWKKAEKDFEAFFKAMGKKAAVFRLTDTAMAKAVGGKRAFVNAQPADYIVTAEGMGTFFAEVKSTTDETSFHFGNIQKEQLAASRRCVAAGGVYLFFIKSQHLDQWFCIPAQVIHHTSLVKKRKHLKWAELKEYEYDA